MARFSHALTNFILFALTVGLFFCGIFFIFLYSSIEMKLKVSGWFLETDKGFLYAALLFLALGFSFCASMYGLFRAPYYQIEMQSEGYKTTVELFLLRKHFELYWKHLFPSHDLKSDVVVHADKRLELIGEIPKVEDEELGEILLKIEKEMGLFLAEQLAYQNPFLVTLRLTQDV